MELGKFVEETMGALVRARVPANVPVTFDLAVVPAAGDTAVHVVSGHPSATPLRLSFTISVGTGEAVK